MMYEFKNDTFRYVRGNYSRFLIIYCGKCGKEVCLYQKDGHEYLLKRMYLDRILAPKNLTNLENTNMQILQCLQCKNILGKRYLYEKENRQAFLLQKEAFVKKVSKGVFEK